MVQRVSVIITSYNQPNTLGLVFEGLLRQRTTTFEVVIADDGSEDDTRRLVNDYAGRAPFPVHWTTQEDRGFRKAKALNNAIRRAEGELLLFLDGDCIPLIDWTACHTSMLTSGYDFSVAGYVVLDLERSRALSVESVRDGSFERVATAKERRRHVRIHRRELLYALLRKPSKPKIRGGNWAVTRRAIETVNGFDENFDGFGKEDSDIRNRLTAAGFRGRSVWNRNWVIHCHHGLDPRRVRPAAIRSDPDRHYYRSRKGARRCAYGLVDERE